MEQAAGSSAYLIPAPSFQRAQTEEALIASMFPEITSLSSPSAMLPDQRTILRNQTSVRITGYLVFDIDDNL